MFRVDFLKSVGHATKMASLTFRLTPSNEPFYSNIRTLLRTQDVFPDLVHNPRQFVHRTRRPDDIDRLFEHFRWKDALVLAEMTGSKSGKQILNLGFLMPFDREEFPKRHIEQSKDDQQLFCG